MQARTIVLLQRAQIDNISSNNIRKELHNYLRNYREASPNTIDRRKIWPNKQKQCRIKVEPPERRPKNGENAERHNKSKKRSNDKIGGTEEKKTISRTSSATPIKFTF